MLDQLVDALKAAKIQRSDLEIAEILWTAALLRDVRRPPRVKPKSSQQKDLSRAQPIEPATAGPEVDSKPGEPGSKHDPGDAATRSELFVSHAGSLEGESLEGERVAAVGARALTQARAISKALRPLSRRYPSRTQRHLDEEKTAERIAQEGLWLPVMVPTRTRWLDAAIVVDGSPSMQVWSRTVHELEMLLQVQGAFDRVRLWRLASEPASGGKQLFVSSPHGIGHHRLRELRDPSGRRLILVISDCVGEPWYDPSLPEAIRDWGRTQPVAILQLLPAWLWRYTSMGASVLALASARERGTSNAALVSAPLSPLAEPGSQATPVVTLDPERVRNWARVLAGQGGARTGAVYLEPGQRIEEPEPTPQQRVTRFLRHASPTAVQLAAIFSATPLQLPIMRAVQRAMLPASNQVHLAEVFLGGLIRRDLRDLAADPEERFYEFHPGVAELLLEDVPPPSVIEVAAKVAAFLESRSNEYGEVLSFLTGEVSDGAEPQTAAARHFATVHTRILKRLPFLKRAVPVGKEVAVPEREKSPLHALADRAHEQLLAPQSLLPRHYATVIGHEPESRLLTAALTAFGYSLVEAKDLPVFAEPEPAFAMPRWLIIVLDVPVNGATWQSMREAVFAENTVATYRRIICTNSKEAIDRIHTQMSEGSVPGQVESMLIEEPGAVAAERLFRHLLEDSQPQLTTQSLSSAVGARYESNWDSTELVPASSNLGFARGRWLCSYLLGKSALWVTDVSAQLRYDRAFFEGSGLTVHFAKSESPDDSLSADDYDVVIVDNIGRLRAPSLRSTCAGKLIVLLQASTEVSPI